MKNKMGIEVPEQCIRTLGYIIAELALKAAEIKPESQQDKPNKSA